MKAISIFCCVSFSFSICAGLNAQSTVYNFLNLSPSPLINGMGMAGAAMHTDDPAAFAFNPAHLGDISQSNTISFQFYPSAEKWPVYVYSTIRNTSFNIGYNFKNMLNELNLSVGLGYIRSKFDYGTFIKPYKGNWVNIDNYEQYDLYGLGIGIDYYVQFNIGFTYKAIYRQNFNYFQYGLITNNNSAFDYGMLLKVPVTKLAFNNLNFEFTGGIPASAYLDISLGYSKLNSGDEVSYIDSDINYPLPRTARLGYDISPALSIKINNSALKLISYDFTVEADDELIKQDSLNYNLSYQGFLGDINLGRNLFELKSDDNVVIHVGHNINLLETISFQIGRFNGRDYPASKSSGIGINTKGLFIFLKGFFHNNTFNFIADHLGIQYYKSYLFKNEPMETKFEGINLIWYGMEL